MTVLDDPKDSQRKVPATIKTIAEALELSPSTVSRALRGESKVKPKTTKLIQDAARDLGYRRDYRGVNLRTGRTNTLCAILASNPTEEFGDPATMHLIQGLIAGVEKTHQKLVIEPVTGENELFEELRDAVEASRFDGIILDHTLPDDRRVDYLIDNNVPFVTFGRTHRADEHAYFDIDNEHAAFVATQSLIEKGHTRIALIDPPAEFLFSAHRRLGYTKALGQAGLTFDPDVIAETSINATNVSHAVTRLMALSNPPTAFVMSNEVATISGVKTCRSLGLDMSGIDFVSRDGTRFLDFFEPAISSCHYPLLEAGIILSGMLIAALRGTPIQQLQQVVQTQFISR